MTLKSDESLQTEPGPTPVKPYGKVMISGIALAITVLSSVVAFGITRWVGHGFGHANGWTEWGFNATAASTIFGFLVAIVVVETRRSVKVARAELAQFANAARAAQAAAELAASTAATAASAARGAEAAAERAETGSGDAAGAARDAAGAARSAENTARDSGAAAREAAREVQGLRGDLPDFLADGPFRQVQRGISPTGPWERVAPLGLSEWPAEDPDWSDRRRLEYYDPTTGRRALLVLEALDDEGHGPRRVIAFAVQFAGFRTKFVLSEPVRPNEILKVI